MYDIRDGGSTITGEILSSVWFLDWGLEVENHLIPSAGASLTLSGRGWELLGLGNTS